MNDLGELRWLARTVAPGAVTSAALPSPALVSTRRSECRDYLRWWINHPDLTGRFARKTRWLRWLPTPVLTWILLTLGYDGLIYSSDAGIIGHVFFQRRGNALHGFSTAVSDEFAGSGYSVLMVLDYVAYASSTAGIVKARIGTGQNNVTRRLLERLQKHADQLGWNVSADGWVTFPQSSPDRDLSPAAIADRHRCAS